MPKNFYAIYLPAHHRGVYVKWEDVQWRLRGQGPVKQHGFRTRSKAVSYLAAMDRNYKHAPSQSSDFQRPPLELLPHHQWQTSSHTLASDQNGSSSNTENLVTSMDIASKTDGTLRENQDPQFKFAKYYAVAVGVRPGLYNAWYGEGGAEEQIKYVKNAKQQRFDDLQSAVHYMCSNGIAKADIRLFRQRFAERPDFKPDPTASFNDEYERLASIHNYKNRTAAKVDVIRDELISHYLPGGIGIDQVDEQDKIILTTDQTLQIYQAMCRHAARPAEATVEDCLATLKNWPFVNIIDLIDACRAKRSPRLFSDWKIFKRYTLLPGNRISINEAKESEFLAPLLQNLRKEPPVMVSRGKGDGFQLELESPIYAYETKQKPGTHSHTFKENGSSLLPMLSSISASNPLSPKSEISSFEDELHIPSPEDPTEAISPLPMITPAFHSQSCPSYMSAFGNSLQTFTLARSAEMMFATEVQVEPLNLVLPAAPAPTAVITVGKKRDCSTMADSVPEPKRKRRRRRKSRTIVTNVVAATPKRRGRPPKIKIERSQGADIRSYVIRLS